MADSFAGAAKAALSKDLDIQALARDFQRLVVALRAAGIAV
jgi:hypothetical protein